MALSFIGKPISLISHSDVRYRGILAGIDPAASTIQLSNVFSMGTESRRPPDQFIPPVQEPYSYIIFRASEVKDLAVDDPAPTRRNVHDDPAVLGASAPLPNAAYPQYGGSPSFQGQSPAAQQQQPSAVPQPSPQQQRQSSYTRQAGQSPSQPNAAAAPPTQAAGAGNGTAPGAAPASRSIHSATTSLETVERALGDLRVSTGPANGAPRGGRRGRGQGHGHGQGADAKNDLRVPTTDFDFQSSNARFDKAALSPRGTPRVDDVEPSSAVEDNGRDSEQTLKEKEQAEAEARAYNPKKSFFDSLSSGSNGPSADAREGGRGRGGRRGGGGRNRREEEREKNVATFGEPGGVGLLGPGAYVGGWGGYGRRGGGRGRRGGPGGAAGGRSRGRSS